MNFESLENDPVLAGIGLPPEELRRLASEVSANEPNAKWRAEAILARACAEGHECAWERFLALYREKLFRAASAIARDPAAGRELASDVLCDLYGSRVDTSGNRVSKLRTYAGRGPLEAWLRTVLAQEHVNRCRASKRFVSFEENFGEAGGADVARDTLSMEAGKIARAIDSVLSALPSESRLLIAAYYLDQRTLAEIGRMLGVHESTVSRRLEKVTSGLRKRVVKELCRNGLSRREAEKALAADVRDLAIDVRSRLTQERPS